MAINEAHFELRKSTNLAANDMLGDAADTGVCDAQAPTFDGSGIAGVTLLNGFNHGTLTGTLRYTNATDELDYIETGDAYGAVVGVSTNGRYAIFSNNASAYVAVDVVSASLPGTDTNDTITLAVTVNDIWDDITSSESWTGDTEYRCLYVANVHTASPFTLIKVWIGSDASGADSLAIGLDPAGVGNGLTGSAAAIANESTAPAGVTFSAPMDEGSALNMGQVNFGQYYPFWIRRTVPATTLTAAPADVSTLSFRIVY